MQPSSGCIFVIIDDAHYGSRLALAPCRACLHRFMDSRPITAVIYTIAVLAVCGARFASGQQVHVRAQEHWRKPLSAGLPTAPSRQAATKLLADSECNDTVQQIACYYDRARSAIVGVQYTLRNSRARRRLCNTAGQPGSTIRLRAGVGVTKLLVRSVAARVVALQFDFSNGRTSSCTITAPTRTNNNISSIIVGRSTIPSDTPADRAASSSAAGSTASLSNVIGDYLNKYPHRLGNGTVKCKNKNCSNNVPSPSPLPGPTVTVFAGPDAAYFLGSLSGNCAKTSGFDILQAVTSSCWAPAASQSSPSPSPHIRPSPTPPDTPSPSPSPIPNPSPSPKPPTSPSPKPQAPSPSPQLSPSPELSPSPNPSPSPSPTPALGPDGYLDVTLFSRGQTTCGVLEPGAALGLGEYLSSQVILLGLGEYSVKAASLDCPCTLVQGTPMYACKYLVQGPSSDQWDAPAVASYLAASITAAGQQICSSPSTLDPTSSFCSSTAQITGLCAAAAASSSGSNTAEPLTCTLAAAPAAWQMTVSLGLSAAACSSNVTLSSGGVASLVQYLSGYLPGFNLTLPTLVSEPLTCSRAQGNAYYQIQAVTISPGSQLDVQGAAEFLASTLNKQQPGPCNPNSSPATSAIQPAFCSDLPQPPVMCGTATYSTNSAPLGCSSAGASFNVLFTSPNDSCNSGGVSLEVMGRSLDDWWRQQLDWLTDGKMFNATTILPGSATPANGACLYRYTVMVYGPISFTAQRIGDLALELMSSSLMQRPVPCKSWQGAEFCRYFSEATYCATMTAGQC